MKNAWEEWSGHSNGDYFGATIIGENVLIIGGRDQSCKPQSKVSVFNIRTKVWKEGPSLENARYAHSTCVTSENFTYALGGVISRITPGRPFVESYTNSVEMLKCDETGQPIGTWQTIPPMRAERGHFESASVDNKVYAIGGKGDTTTMEVFDPKVDSWKDCRSKSQVQGCHSHAVATSNREIYVFSVDGFCEKYNPATDTWTTIAALNDATGNAYLRGSAVMNDKIYLVGGENCAETDLHDVEKNMWSKGPPMPKIIDCTKCVLFK